MKGTKIAIIAFIAIDVITEVTSDQPSLASLGVHLTSDVVQTVASAAMGWAAGAAILAVSPAAPVVVVFIAVVMVGFVAGMGLAYLDTHFRITERARARMMSFEQNVINQWPAVRQQTVALENRIIQATTVAGNRISVEAYKVDRYFISISAMMAADAEGWLVR